MMAISYTWVVKKLDTTQVAGIDNVVSHIHFDYVGTADDGSKAFCQGTLPFQLEVFVQKSIDGENQIIPGVFDPNAYTRFEDLTQAQVVSWLEQNAPDSLVTTFQDIISKRLQASPQSNRSDLPWLQQGA